MGRTISVFISRATTQTTPIKHLQSCQTGGRETGILKIAPFKKPIVDFHKIWLKSQLASLFMIFLALFVPGSVAAQEEEIKTPYYLVQAGDSLWGIAIRLGIPMEELQSLNGISDPNQLQIGMQLRIPAPAGVSGRVDTRTIAYGDTIQSLSHRYDISPEAFVQLNRLTSPDELVAGAIVIVPIENEAQTTDRQLVLAPGENFVEMAVIHNENPWTLLLQDASDSTSSSTEVTAH